MGVNYPREYQWKDHDNAELPIWVDLTTHLKPGHNVLCVEVETNGTTPAVILSGEVDLDTGEKIPLPSNARWAAKPAPQKFPQNSWILPFSPIAVGITPVLFLGNALSGAWFLLGHLPSPSADKEFAPSPPVQLAGSARSLFCQRPLPMVFCGSPPTPLSGSG